MPVKFWFRYNFSTSYLEWDFLRLWWTKICNLKLYFPRLLSLFMCPFVQPSISSVHPPLKVEQSQNVGKQSCRICFKGSKYVFRITCHPLLVLPKLGSIYLRCGCFLLQLWCTNYNATYECPKLDPW